MDKEMVKIADQFNEIDILKKKHFIQYFLDIRGLKSKHTSLGYERDIKDFFKVNKVEEITLDDIIKVNIFHAQNFILELESKGLSSATINRKISSLSALYKWIMKYVDNNSGFQIIKFNPFSNLKEEKPTINNEETAFLTEEECKVLLNSIDTSTILGLRNKALLSLALTTALRKSEIINIKLKDIVKYGDYDVIKVTRKGNKLDMVKLQPKVKELIYAYVIESGRSFQKNEDAYLFIGHSLNKHNKEKLDASTLNYMIKKACKSANIDKNLRVHSTRHTAITIAITKGVTIEKVREFAAHKNISTTNRYIHSIDKLKDNAGDIIDLL
ncbi:tyrosine-type recombinase/integrase [Clostridium sp.]|uniref:tyrosine-type recombinase/integrase n=1 Tax=Clostridium sp. TaxID=1506 RepID=UPI002FCBE495